MSKILIVGDKPKTPDSRPFENARCKATLMSWINTLGIEEYELANSVDKDLKTKAVKFDKVIALGNNAYEVLEKLTYYEAPRVVKRYPPVFKLPHPSGRNRQLNDSIFISAVLARCYTWLQGR